MSDFVSESQKSSLSLSLWTIRFGDDLSLSVVSTIQLVKLITLRLHAVAAVPWLQRPEKAEPGIFFLVKMWQSHLGFRI